MKLLLNKILTLVLIVGILACISVTVWTVFYREPENEHEQNTNDTQNDTYTEDTSPDYPPMETEKNQDPIIGGGRPETPKNDNSITITYSSKATADLSEKVIYLYYANPSSSNRNVTISVVIDGKAIATSNIINPGYEVNLLSLDDDAVKNMEEGSYNAELIINSYDTVSGDKDMVNAKGELSVTITK